MRVREREEWASFQMGLHLPPTGCYCFEERRRQQFAILLRSSIRSWLRLRKNETARPREAMRDSEAGLRLKARLRARAREGCEDRESQIARLRLRPREDRTS